MKMYRFRVSSAEIIQDDKVIPRSKAPVELWELQNFIHICNDRCLVVGNRIDYIGTNYNGNLIYLRSQDGRGKEFLAEPLAPAFMNFLFQMILLHSFGSDKELLPYKKRVLSEYFSDSRL